MSSFFPLSPPLYIHINILCSLTKSPDILLFVQRKHYLPLRGRCTNPLEKTSWGLRKKRRGPVRTRRLRTPPYPPPPPSLPLPSECNNTSPFDISGSRFFGRGVTSRRYPAMPKQMVADCCLQRRRTCSLGHDERLGNKKPMDRK